MSNKRTMWFLIVILFLATFLRVFQLDQVPIELFGDEVDVGYHAYSLLQTGRDYYGQFLPTYIHSLAEWRTPLLMYLTVPSIAIFGLNEWGVRIPPAVFGILGVLFLYLLIKELFEDEKWAILGALLLAINPWSIHYGRAAFEVALLLLLILSGTYFFLRGLKNPRFLIVSAVLFGLTLYTYSTANMFLPFFLLSLITIYRKELIRLRTDKTLWISLAIFLIVLIPITKKLVFGQARERFNLISVFSDQKIIEEIHLRRLGGVSFEKPTKKVGLLERIFTNRPVYWTLAISQNYLSAFSLEFLFARGDPYFRHSVSKVGEFYLVEVVLVVLGALALLNFKNKSKWLVFTWLFLAPIPSSLTQGGGSHATRLFIMIPPMVVLSSFGLLQLIKLAKKKKIAVFLLFIVYCLLLFNLSFYLYRYFLDYPRESWRYWHYGYKEGIQAMTEIMDNYETIVITNAVEPSLLRFLFWSKYNPVEFQRLFAGDKPKKNILAGVDGFKLGEKFYFGVLNTEAQEKGGLANFLTPKTLYFASQENDIGGEWDWQKNPPSGVKVLTTINNPYNQPIFYLVTHD